MFSLLSTGCTVNRVTFVVGTNHNFIFISIIFVFIVYIPTKHMNVGE